MDHSCCSGFQAVAAGTPGRKQSEIKAIPERANPD